MNESLITTIKRHMLREDAGLSGDGTAVNNVGGGQIDGIGIGARGEPGARKKRRGARRENPKLFSAISRGGTVEMTAVKEDDEIDEGDPVVNTSPTISDDPTKDRSYPNTKKKLKKILSKRSLRRGDADIVLDPELPTRFEDVVDEENPCRGLTLTQADFWIRQGIFGPKAKDFINYWRQVLVDPEKAIHNQTYRPYLARAFRDLLSMIMNDVQLTNRVRTILMKFKFRGDEDEIPEDNDEAERFARWKEQSDFAEAFESTPIATLQHQMASCADPGRRARLQAELRRRTGKQLHRPGQLRVGGRPR